MNIAKRPKYINSGRTSVKTEEKIPINFDIIALDLFCSYILSENRYIRNSHLINLRNIIDMLDMSLYLNDPEKVRRLEFIRKGLEGKINAKIKNSAILLKYINGGLSDSNLIDLDKMPELSTEEIEWIDETVSESLKYTFMFSKVDRIQDLCTRFKAEDYRYRGEIVREFESIIDELKTDFRRVKVDPLSDITFTLRPGAYEEVVRDIYDQVTNPSRRLICGMQGLNELTGGGFESGRTYLLFGLASVGKSLTLLNLAYQIKKYNKGYRPKDPTKIPCIVILTMENTVQETVTRLFSMSTASEDIKNFSYEEVIDKLKTDGELYLADDSPIDIVIKYKPNRSVDTGYLYTLTEDLEDEGYEVICLIQDHIKRIRSCYSQTDLRIELGEVVNEFKVFAAAKDIPVISDSHLNRDAAKIIDNAGRTNKADLTRMLGRANVGESMLMIDNADCAFIINKDYDKDGNMYMVFFRIKMRDKCTLRDYIAQPFVYGSTIKLVEDIFMPVPAFKESLHTPQNLINNTKVKQSEYSNIPDLDDDNIFTKIDMYSNNTNTELMGEIKTSYIPEPIGIPSNPLPFEDMASFSTLPTDMDLLPESQLPHKYNAVEFMYGDSYIYQG